MSEHVMSLFREPVPVPVLGASMLLQSEKNKNQRYPSLVAPCRPNDTRWSYDECSSPTAQILSEKKKEEATKMTCRGDIRITIPAETQLVVRGRPLPRVTQGAYDVGRTYAPPLGTDGPMHTPAFRTKRSRKRKKKETGGSLDPRQRRPWHMQPTVGDGSMQQGEKRKSAGREQGHGMGRCHGIPAELRDCELS